MTDYPEHAKLREVVAATQAAAEFLLWVSQRYGATLCVWVETDRRDGWEPVQDPVAALLAEWKGIDRAKLEAEKVALLEEQLAVNREAGHV